LALTTGVADLSATTVRAGAVEGPAFSTGSIFPSSTASASVPATGESEPTSSAGEAAADARLPPATTSAIANEMALNTPVMG